MKIIIFGAKGFLGKKLYSHFSKNNDVLRTSTSQSEGYTKVDVGKKEEVETVFSEFNPDLVINCAAICDVEKCEKNPELASEVHVEGAKNIAECCKKYNAKIVHISTDYIFNGMSGPYDEESAPSPISTYGKTKAEGEKVIKQTVSKFIILRPPILYGFNDKDDKPTFTLDVLSKLNSEEEIKVDNERIKYPVLIDDIAACIEHLITTNAEGVFNIATKKGYTRFEWAKLIAKTAGYDDSKICAEEKSEYNQNRPKDVKLITTKLKETGFEPAELKEGIKIMLKQTGDLK